MHWSFGLVFASVLFVGSSNNLVLGQVLWLWLFVMAMFVCIVLHEFGHALTARQFGVSTRDVVLLPIGGMARLNKLPEKPLHEFLVAIAGPAVNVAISLVLSLYFFFVPFREMFERELTSEIDLIGDYHFFVPALIFLNIMLAVFNLLPAFPMDGGRILRALLSTKLNRTKATLIAARTGQVIAAAMFVAGGWNHHFTVALIGVFIFFTANREYEWVRSEGILSEIKVEEVMRREFTRLVISDLVLTIHYQLAQKREFNFLVFDESANLVGTLSHRVLADAVKKGSPEILVGDIFSDGYSTVGPTATLKEANEKLQKSEVGILPVFQAGMLTGVLDHSSILDALRAKSMK